MNNQGPNKDSIVNRAGPPGGPAWDETDPVQWQPDDGFAGSVAADGADEEAPGNQDDAAGSGAGGAGGAGGDAPGNQEGGIEAAEFRQSAEWKQQDAEHLEATNQLNEMMRRNEEMSREPPRFRKGK
ncbi:hypothetical protein V1527DRAFT_486092 [Lipomyces starkeyi]